jgi:excisionase family DNA binding protein
MSRSNATERSPYLTVPEVAEILRVKPRAVYDLLKRGRLDYTRAGSVKLIRITRTSVEAFIETTETATP